MRFQELSINCKGLGCAGILYGVGGDPSAPAVLTAAYRKVAPPAAKLIAEEAVAQLRSRGIEVRGVGETRFQTLPQSVDVLAEAAGAGGSTVLNLQVWDFGISRTGTTDYQPSVMIQARLIRRDGARLVYAKAYNFGPEASGLPVNLGGSDIRFPSVSAAQAQPERLLQGLRAGVREVLGRIANDLAQ